MTSEGTMSQQAQLAWDVKFNKFPQKSPTTWKIAKYPDDKRHWQLPPWKKIDAWKFLRSLWKIRHLTIDAKQMKENKLVKCSKKHFTAVKKRDQILLAN